MRSRVFSMASRVLARASRTAGLLSGASWLMSHDSRGHCFFTRQPASPHETNEAIESAWASCCGALRYGGTDDGILIRLAELGLAEQCDFRLKHDSKPRARTCVSFEFAGQSKTAAAAQGEITTYVADFVGKSTSSDGNVRSLRVTEVSASFVYEWGYVLGDPCRATFVIERQSDQSTDASEADRP